MKKRILIAAPLALIAPAAHAQPPHDGGRIFAMIDANGDGKLDDTERAAARKAAEERRAEFIKKFDTDGDGKLSPAELRNAREDAGKAPPAGNVPPEI